MKRRTWNLLIQKSFFKERFNQLVQNISNQKLRELVDVSDTTLYNWKSGKVLPQRKCAEKLAEYFNVSIYWLLGKDKVV